VAIGDPFQELKAIINSSKTKKNIVGSKKMSSDIESNYENTCLTRGRRLRLYHRLSAAANCGSDNAFLSALTRVRGARELLDGLVRRQ